MLPKPKIAPVKKVGRPTKAEAAKKGRGRPPQVAKRGRGRPPMETPLGVLAAVRRAENLIDRAIEILSKVH